MSAQLQDVAELEVGEWTKDDVNALAVISYENKLAAGWRFLKEATVIVARYYGTAVAFAAYHYVPSAIMVDELWSLQSKIGVRGLSALSTYLEDLTQWHANADGKTWQIGGIVHLNDPLHKRALQRRGYAVVAEVLAKEFHRA